MIYYSEMIPIKISKEERHIGQSPGEIRHELSVLLSQESCSLQPSHVYSHIFLKHLSF